MEKLKLQGGGPAIRTATYNRFKGVDFSTAPSLVDQSRSPWAPNLVSDTGGMPEKRLGWRTLFGVEAPINGLFNGVLGGQSVFLVHGGTKLYRWTDRGGTVIRENLYNGKSAAFSMGNQIWILTGGDYLCYDGVTVAEVSAGAYIPTTVVGRLPAGGGQPYEAVNLLQAKRRNEFECDGTATVYQLDGRELDPALVEAALDGAPQTEGKDFTVDRKAGTVTFQTAPPKPALGKRDNLVITYAKTVEGHKQKIASCSICALYGDRVFVSGNPLFPAFDYHSGFADPTYFPETGFAKIGVDATAVMGYLRVGGLLAILKEDNEQDSTIFLRRESRLGSETVYPVEQGVAGVGAVSRHCFCNLMDEPLFLSKTGVFALVSNNITAEKSVQNRSFFLDAVLTKEPNLHSAVATRWNGYYVLCVNGRGYLMDGKQPRAYRSQAQGEFLYECYHWEHIPAVCLMEFGGALYFGTAEGSVCKFNTDVERMTRFNDDGAAVSCAWSTKADDDGDVSRLKTMIKKGNSVTIKPYIRSSAKVILRTDKDFGKTVRYGTMDIFDWNEIDFDRLSFNGNDGPQEILFKTKVKKYKRLQIIVGNDGLSEGFGIFGITKHYTVGNYGK